MARTETERERSKRGSDGEFEKFPTYVLIFFILYTVL